MSALVDWLLADVAHVEFGKFQCTLTHLCFIAHARQLSLFEPRIWVYDQLAVPLLNDRFIPGWYIEAMLCATFKYADGYHY